MSEATRPAEQGAGDTSAPKQDAASGGLTPDQQLEQLNKWGNALVTKRMAPLMAKFDEVMTRLEGSTKQSEPAKTGKDADLMAKFEEQGRKIEQLQKENAAKDKRLADREVISHVSTALSKHNVQMAPAAVKLLKDYFQFDGERVVAKDEYGDEIETDKVIAKFLAENEGFRPARNASGTAQRGGGGHRPNLPDNTGRQDSLSYGQEVKDVQKKNLKKLDPTLEKTFGQLL